MEIPTSFVLTRKFSNFLPVALLRDVFLRMIPFSCHLEIWWARAPHVCIVRAIIIFSIIKYLYYYYYRDDKNNLLKKNGKDGYGVWLCVFCFVLPFVFGTKINICIRESTKITDKNMCPQKKKKVFRLPTMSFTFLEMRFGGEGLEVDTYHSRTFCRFRIFQFETCRFLRLRRNQFCSDCERFFCLCVFKARYILVSLWKLFVGYS